MGKVLRFPHILAGSTKFKNPYWRQIFNGLAYGRSPQETYIRNGFLCCDKAGKRFTYKLTGNTSETICDDIKQLLCSVLDIKQQREKSLRKHVYKVKEMPDSWRNIKSKGTKTFLLELHAIHLSKQTGEDPNDILARFNFLIDFRTYGEDYIVHMHEGRIDHIDIRERRARHTNMRLGPAKPSPKPSVASLWTKYQKDLAKIITNFRTKVGIIQ